LDVQEPRDIEPAFKAAAKGRAEAILVTGNPALNSQRQQVTDLAAKHRLPASYGRLEFIDAGGLMYYGTNYVELSRRAATYVDKILKCAKPAEIPVEQPKKFELIVSLPAAKKIGVTIPQWTLMKADKVIK
jgi:putative ABC transport system substrate-binding protein